MPIRKRLEIFIETTAAKAICALLDQAGATGYSVLPVVSGRGRDGDWSADGQISSANQLVCIVCIIDEAGIADLKQLLLRLLSRQAGFVSISDVEILREDRF